MNQAVNLSRRNLLKGRAIDTPLPVRPPGAAPESIFTDTCTACGDCVAACPESIIISGSAGYPEINFRLGECTFCSACIDSCEDGALSQSVQPALAVRLQLGEKCLARRQVVCQSCGDACQAKAIRFPPRLGKIAIPDIDEELCNSCGACVAACPENALEAIPNG